jgi:4-amino-4-deoxy-L-arabinose transferase-like glycosyltransferase
MRGSIVDKGVLIFCCAVFGAFLVPALFMDGMFHDGAFYAAISRNLAEGNGTIWNLQFSQTLYTEMHEQPPVMFVLQALFFKTFGSGIYTERIYSLLTAVITSLILHRSWKLISELKGDETGSKTDWLPLLLWFIMPVTYYVFTNNLVECTMTVFVLLAFNSILRALIVRPEKHFHWVIAGLWILLAGLTKGVQGTFLLSAPFWCWLILKNGNAKHFFVRTASIALVPAVFVVIAWFTPVIHDSFSAYFDSRFGKTFSGLTAHSDNRFHILYELLLDTLPALAILLVMVIAGRKTEALKTHFKENARVLYFILACALSGILPLMVTLEQRGFYLATALPLVALCLAVLVKPIAERFSVFILARNKVRITVFTIAVISVIAVLTITFINAGKFKCHEDKILLLREVAGITGENVILGVSDATFSDWTLTAYAQRNHHLSFDSERMPEIEWFLVEKGRTAPPNTIQISLNSPLFDLYRK